MLTSTRDARGATQYVPDRTALLLKFAWDEERGDELRKLYDLRSNIIHGKKTLSDRITTKIIFSSSDLCRKAIIGAILFFNDFGLGKKPSGDMWKRLKIFLDTDS